MAAELGTGTTLTFSGFTAELLEVGGPSLSRGAIDTTHLGTTGARTFIPTDLYDGGEITLTVHHTATTAVPITGAAGTLTIAWSGSGGNVDWECSAFLTGYEPQAPLEDKMTASVTFKVAGAVTITTS